MVLLCGVVAGVLWGIRVAAYSPLAAPSEGPGASAQPVGAEGPRHLWRGAVHAHSRHSDGTGRIEEIVAAAQRAGLDFLVLTDHNPLGREQRPDTGWYGDLLLIVGEEVSTHEGHIVAIEIPPHRYQLGPTKRQALADVEDLGGWAWVAHPHHPAESFEGGWSGLDGVEVVNLAGAWARAPWSRKLATAAAYPLNSHYAILGLLAPGLPGLDTWDQRTRLSGRGEGSWPRPLAALGAADAHGPAFGLGPSYESIFSTVQMLVWASEQPALRSPGAAQSVLAALRRGRAAVLVTSVGGIGGLSFVARAQGGEQAGLGQFAPWEQGPWTLEAGVEAEGSYRIKLLRDGHIVETSNGEPLRALAEEAGTYRIEVYRVAGAGDEDPVPWILSNPIYLWPSAARQAAVVHRAPPLPPPPLALQLDSEPGWQAGSSDDVSAEAIASDEGQVLRLELPEDPGPNAYAALALWADEAWDWSGSGGLVVSLQSEEDLRVFVEVRSRDADGEERSWHYSVKATAEALPTAIPWSRWWLRWNQASQRRTLLEGGEWVAAAQHALGEEELRRIVGIFLVVTPGILDPGSTATLTLEQIGIY